MEEALIVLMDGICKSIDASNSWWIGALRMDASADHDPMRGWRPRAYRYLHPSPAHEAAYRAQVAKIYRSEENYANHLTVQNVGKFRSYRMRQVLPAKWFKGPYYREFYASRGIQDACFIIFPVHEDYESYFAFHRTGSKNNFTDLDEEVAAYALRGIKWFHRQLILGNGVFLAEGPLSPVHRRIVQLLLTGRSEKEISTEIGKSPHTIHKYITEIFRKFGVNSRAALAALWLGQKS